MSRDPKELERIRQELEKQREKIAAGDKKGVKPQSEGDDAPAPEPKEADKKLRRQDDQNLQFARAAWRRRDTAYLDQVVAPATRALREQGKAFNHEAGQHTAAAIPQDKAPQQKQLEQARSHARIFQAQLKAFDPTAELKTVTDALLKAEEAKAKNAEAALKREAARYAREAAYPEQELAENLYKERVKESESARDRAQAEYDQANRDLQNSSQKASLTEAELANAIQAFAAQEQKLKEVKLKHDTQQDRIERVLNPQLELVKESFESQEATVAAARQKYDEKLSDAKEANTELENWQKQVTKQQAVVAQANQQYETQQKAAAELKERAQQAEDKFRQLDQNYNQYLDTYSQELDQFSASSSSYQRELQQIQAAKQEAQEAHEQRQKQIDSIELEISERKHEVENLDIEIRHVTAQITQQERTILELVAASQAATDLASRAAETFSDAKNKVKSARSAFRLLSELPSADKSDESDEEKLKEKLKLLQLAAEQADSAEKKLSTALTEAKKAAQQAAAQQEAAEQAAKALKQQLHEKISQQQQAQENLAKANELQQIQLAAQTEAQRQLVAVSSAEESLQKEEEALSQAKQKLDELEHKKDTTGDEWRKEKEQLELINQQYFNAITLQQQLQENAEGEKHLLELQLISLEQAKVVNDEALLAQQQAQEQLTAAEIALTQYQQNISALEQNITQIQQEIEHEIQHESAVLSQLEQAVWESNTANMSAQQLKQQQEEQFRHAYNDLHQREEIYQKLNQQYSGSRVKLIFDDLDEKARRAEQEASQLERDAGTLDNQAQDQDKKARDTLGPVKYFAALQQAAKDATAATTATQEQLEAKKKALNAAKLEIKAKQGKAKLTAYDKLEQAKELKKQAAKLLEQAEEKLKQLQPVGAVDDGKEEKKSISSEEINAITAQKLVVKQKRQELQAATEAETKAQQDLEEFKAQVGTQEKPGTLAQEIEQLDTALQKAKAYQAAAQAKFDAYKPTKLHDKVAALFRQPGAPGAGSSDVLLHEDKTKGQRVITFKDGNDEVAISSTEQMSHVLQQVVSRANAEGRSVTTTERNPADPRVKMVLQQKFSPGAAEPQQEKLVKYGEGYGNQELHFIECNDDAEEKAVIEDCKKLGAGYQFIICQGDHYTHLDGRIPDTTTIVTKAELAGVSVPAEHKDHYDDFLRDHNGDPTLAAARKAKTLPASLATEVSRGTSKFKRANTTALQLVHRFSKNLGLKAGDMNIPRQQATEISEITQLADEKGVLKRHIIVATPKPDQPDVEEHEVKRAAGWHIRTRGDIPTRRIDMSEVPEGETTTERLAAALDKQKIAGTVSADAAHDILAIEQGDAANPLLEDRTAATRQPEAKDSNDSEVKIYKYNPNPKTFHSILYTRTPNRPLIALVEARNAKAFTALPATEDKATGEVTRQLDAKAIAAAQQTQTVLIQVTEELGEIKEKDDTSSSPSPKQMGLRQRLIGKSNGVDVDYYRVNPDYAALVKAAHEARTGQPRIVGNTRIWDVPLPADTTGKTCYLTQYVERLAADNKTVIGRTFSGHRSNGSEIQITPKRQVEQVLDLISDPRSESMQRQCPSTDFTETAEIFELSPDELRLHILRNRIKDTVPADAKSGIIYSDDAVLAANKARELDAAATASPLMSDEEKAAFTRARKGLVHAHQNTPTQTLPLERACLQNATDLANAMGAYLSGGDDYDARINEFSELSLTQQTLILAGLGIKAQNEFGIISRDCNKDLFRKSFNAPGGLKFELSQLRQQIKSADPKNNNEVAAVNEKAKQLYIKLMRNPGARARTQLESLKASVSSQIVNDSSKKQHTRTKKWELPEAQIALQTERPLLIRHSQEQQMRGSDPNAWDTVSNSYTVLDENNQEISFTDADLTAINTFKSVLDENGKRAFNRLQGEYQRDETQRRLRDSGIEAKDYGRDFGTNPFTAASEWLGDQIHGRERCTAVIKPSFGEELTVELITKKDGGVTLNLRDHDESGRSVSVSKETVAGLLSVTLKAAGPNERINLTHTSTSLLGHRKKPTKAQKKRAYDSIKYLREQLTEQYKDKPSSLSSQVAALKAAKEVARIDHRQITGDKACAVRVTMVTQFQKEMEKHAQQQKEAKGGALPLEPHNYGKVTLDKKPIDAETYETAKAEFESYLTTYFKLEAAKALELQGLSQTEIGALLDDSKAKIPAPEQQVKDQHIPGWEAGKPIADWVKQQVSTHSKRYGYNPHGDVRVQFDETRGVIKACATFPEGADDKAQAAILADAAAVLERSKQVLQARGKTVTKAELKHQVQPSHSWRSKFRTANTERIALQHNNDALTPKVGQFNTTINRPPAAAEDAKEEKLPRRVLGRTTTTD